MYLKFSCEVQLRNMYPSVKCKQTQGSTNSHKHSHFNNSGWVNLNVSIHTLTTSRHYEN